MAIEVYLSQFRHSTTSLATLHPHENRCDRDAPFILLGCFSADSVLFHQNSLSQTHLGGACSQILAFDTVLDAHAKLVLVLKHLFPLLTVYAASGDDVPFPLYFLIRTIQHPHNAYDQH